MTDLRADILDSLDPVGPEAWDALVGADEGAGPPNPFVEHAFLRGLEVTGCVGSPQTGWLPRHVVVRRGQDLVGAMPLYEKLDSYGEYIFDWSWAQAAERAGMRYYPKLVGAVPFTPVTGPRLLLDPAVAGDRTRRRQVVGVMLDAVERLADRRDASSVHVLFCTRGEQDLLAERGYLPRASYQFHWENEAGWRSFDDFLGSMRSRMRKQVLRERARAAAHGLRLSVRRGPELGPREWDALWAFYQDTGARKWGTPYLNRAFFQYAQEHLRHRVVCAFAHDGDAPVAGTLMLTKGDGLYGRYWGAVRDLDCMHFELCYYLPIAWCLAEGLRRFEAGAQGEHKLRRGLMPRRCSSAHRILRPGLDEAVARVVAREEVVIEREMDLLGEHGPFRRGEPPEG